MDYYLVLLVWLSIVVICYYYYCYYFLRRAKLLLKKKRYLENLLDKTDTQMDNLQQMVETLEYTQVELQVVEGLKQGNESLEAMHKVSIIIYNGVSLIRSYMCKDNFIIRTPL